MIRVFVDDKVIATIPAPISDQRPVPIRDLEVETAGEPETMVFTVNASDGVSVRGTNVFKAAVLEGVILVKALIVGSIVAIPVIVVHVRRTIDTPFCRCSSSLLKLRAFAFGGAGGMRP